MRERDGEKAAESIRRLWEAGRASLKQMRLRRQKESPILKKDFFEAEARRTRLNPDTVGKAQRVARDFSRAEINQLCALAHKGTSDFAASHVVILLRAPHKHRLALARAAVRNEWNTQMLAAILRNRFGRRRHGGKTPYDAKNPMQAILWLEQMCEKWCRWCDANRPYFSDQMKRRIDAAKATLTSVQDLAAAHLTRLSERPSKSTRARHARVG